MSQHEQSEHFDPLEQALASNAADGKQRELRMQHVLRKAKRSVGTRDMLALMLVNLWVTLAKIMVPFFRFSETRSISGNKKGVQNG